MSDKVHPLHSGINRALKIKKLKASERYYGTFFFFKKKNTLTKILHSYKRRKKKTTHMFNVLNAVTLFISHEERKIKSLSVREKKRKTERL